MRGEQLRSVVETEFSSAFRAVWEEGNRAWNEGDFERAYGALPDDFEYDLAATWPQSHPLRGRKEVVAFFEDFRETFPDTRGGPAIEFRVAQVSGPVDGTLVVGFPVTGTGRTSGAALEMEIWQVWEVAGGIPRQLKEFHDRSEAMSAAGIDEASA
jgi:ketosteroid isomerase-like protein